MPWRCAFATDPRSTHPATTYQGIALEQALYERAIGGLDGLILHSDRDVQYLSIRYTERLAEAGIERFRGKRWGLVRLR